MNALLSLYHITKELLELVEQPISKENRDSIIEKITSLLDLRDRTIKEISPPYTDDENKVGTEIVRMNKIIDSKLAEIKLEIQTDLAQLKKSKATSKKYANPYQVGSADGMFFDKRK
ncbi:flagellar protein FliT [Bacillus sp. JJ1566]|uniref:flagellar protein FliT n=1 Tax=Bacillus sp. JJ1566 TaxID=3122961 RepID=UPI003000071B